MLVSQNALAKFVDLSDVSTHELSDLYNNYGGLEVESIQPVVPQNKYIIGKIVDVQRHPDADTLFVCQVDIGSERLEIVCGATNVARDKYVIVAPVGTIMPNGMKIERRNIRGVTSSGMLCSLNEIGLEDKYVDKRYEKGIYLFEDEPVEIGADVLETLDLTTSVFDLSITPNRADCLNYRGLAYETAALTRQKLDASAFVYEMPQGTFSVKDYVQTLNIASDHVRAYNLIAYKHVKIKQSPQWMKSFLIAHHVRPINNVVDMTNYVMLMLGLPLHAFDAAKLPEKQIVVRQANKNEKLITLDDKERTLDNDDVVISTGDVSVALAGVMGGANTEIDEATTSVVLEAAIFNPVNVRKTAVKFDLRSEASQRMEKMLDPTLPELALACMSQLMVKYADAEVSTDILSANTIKNSETVIDANYEAIAKKIGITTLTPKAIDDIFIRLSFTFTHIDAENIRITPPSWRPDITIFEDIVEEVARLTGLENLPNRLPLDTTRPVFRTSKMLFLDHVHATLQALGLQEILTYSLAGKENATLGQYKSDLIPVNILHPLNSERETVRTTTYYSMLETLQYHYNHDFASVAFYEVTDVYGKEQSYPVLAFGGYGNIEVQQLYELNTAIDFPLLKTWFERLLTAIPLQKIVYRRTENELFHPGIAADVYYENHYLGTFGKVHPQIANMLDLHPDFYLGELRIDELYHLEKTAAEKTTPYEPISKFPAIERDLALVMKREIAVGTVVDFVWQHAGEYCRQVEVFDIYTGSHIAETKKSIALKITFNSKTETLTNQFVGEIIDTLIANLDEQLGVTLRK